MFMPAYILLRLNRLGLKSRLHTSGQSKNIQMMLRYRTMAPTLGMVKPIISIILIAKAKPYILNECGVVTIVFILKTIKAIINSK